MNRYLIDVPHDPTHRECLRLAESFNRAGAHYMAKADFGCEVGVHNSWLIVEALSDVDAKLVVPPALRCNAKVTRLGKLALSELGEASLRAEEREAYPVGA